MSSTYKCSGAHADCDIVGDFFSINPGCCHYPPYLWGPETHRRARGSAWCSVVLIVGGRGEEQNKTSLIKEHNSFLFLLRGRPNQIRPTKTRLISRGADGPRGKFNSMCGLSAMMCVFSVQMVQLGFVIHILTFHFTPPPPPLLSPSLPPPTPTLFLSLSGSLTFLFFSFSFR